MGVFGTFDVGKGFPFAACLLVIYTVGSSVFGFLPGDGHLVAAGYLGGNAADREDIFWFSSYRFSFLCFSTYRSGSILLYRGMECKGNLRI